MSDYTKNPLQGRTVIGTFTETWDAESALEDLKFAGFDGRVRYVLNDTVSVPDDTKIHGGFQSYFARIHGFEDHDEYLDSKGNFSVNPEAEDYFAETYEKKFHVLLVQTTDDIDKAIDTIRIHHGEIEVRHWSFFTAMAGDNRRLPGESYQQPPKLHPTNAIEVPLDSTL
ncbi:MAG: hypothetical protein EOP10_03710 [Proteobacteria bacterium]|nr:MAG: hypothetical protein EOP10_03710 [Pseudomonadota bacterium]